MTGTTEPELPAPTREALGEMIGSLARNKAAMGRRYGEWAVSAPTLESGVAAAAMAQDELGHARSSFPLLTQLGLEVDDDERMDVSGAARLLADPLPDWETFIAVNLVLDGMLTAFLEAARESSFPQLAQRARKILQEERSHAAHAAAWARRLVRDANRREAFERALRPVWAEASAWPGDDERYARLAAEGLVAGSPDDLRAEVRSVVEAAVGTDTVLDAATG